MYEEFADVYDALMNDFDYPAWAAFYEKLMRGDTPVRTVLELGCGTGAMAVELAKAGYTVTGVDLSERMLRKAAEKVRCAGVSVALTKQDMRAFAVHKPMDAVVVPCDGLNYLLDEASLEACFSCAYRALRPGGVLAFDVSTQAKFERMLGALFYEDRADITYFWENARSGERGIDMALTFFVRGPGGKYTRFDERQRQRAHTMKELEEALARAGFAQISFYGDRVLTAPGALEERMHATARKPDKTNV